MHDDNDKKYSAYKFDKIHSIVKDKTYDYIQLHAIDEKGNITHLSTYHPDETAVEYDEIRFNNLHYCGDFCLCIMGRIDPIIRYTRDEDVIPVDSLEALKLLAKRAKYDRIGDYEKVQIIEQRLARNISRTIRYQEAALKSLDIHVNNSYASVTSI